jgi:hypothetical protein
MLRIQLPLQGISECRVSNGDPAELEERLLEQGKLSSSSASTGSSDGMRDNQFPSHGGISTALGVTRQALAL